MKDSHIVKCVRQLVLLQIEFAIQSCRQESSALGMKDSDEITEEERHHVVQLDAMVAKMVKARAVLA